MAEKTGLRCLVTIDDIYVQRNPSFSVKRSWRRLFSKWKSELRVRKILEKFTTLFVIKASLTYKLPINAYVERNTRRRTKSRYA